MLALMENYTDVVLELDKYAGQGLRKLQPDKWQPIIHKTRRPFSSMACVSAAPVKILPRRISAWKIYSLYFGGPAPSVWVFSLWV
jgi:hypothetical protein